MTCKGLLTCPRETTPLIIDTEVIAVSPTLPLTLEISRNGPDYDFSWNSRADKLYDLLSSTDFSTPPSTWPVYDDGVTLYENIVPSGLTTVHRVLVVSGDVSSEVERSGYFYRIIRAEELA